MSFPVERAPAALGHPAHTPTERHGVVSVEGAVKGGRSPAKRTLYCVRNANTLKGLGLVAAFLGQPRARPAERTSPPSGAGLGVGAPEGLGRGLRLTGAGSTGNDLNPPDGTDCFGQSPSASRSGRVLPQDKWNQIVASRSLADAQGLGKLTLNANINGRAFFQLHSIVKNWTLLETETNKFNNASNRLKVLKSALAN